MDKWSKYCTYFFLQSNTFKDFRPLIVNLSYTIVFQNKSGNFDKIFTAIFTQLRFLYKMVMAEYHSYPSDSFLAID